MKIQSVQLAAWDHMVRQGETRAVLIDLSKLKSDGFRQREAQAVLIEVAKLARRCGTSELGLYFLKPLLFIDGEPNSRAPMAAKLEYATSLLELGLRNEGRKWLSEVSAEALPQKYLIEAFDLFSQWEYAQAVPILEQYIARLDSNSYAWAVAQVNYLSALSFSKDIDALARKLIRDFTQKNHLLLIGNCFEILGSQKIERGDLDQAETLLNEAARLHHSVASRGSTYIAKWQLILEIKKGRKISYEQIYSFKREHAWDWETHRSLDLQWALSCNDKALLDYLWFGSPALAFRHLIERNHRPEHSKYEYLVPKDILQPRFLEQHQEPVNQIKPMSQAKLNELLATMCRDFYRPKTVFEIFSDLFSDEYFSIEHSPPRIHQLLWRLRRELKKMRIPIQIQFHNGFYFVLSKSLLALPMASLHESFAIKNLRSERVLAFLGQKSRRTIEIADHLGLELRMTQNYLRDLLQAGLVESPKKGHYLRKVIM